jgi:ATP-dependent exoDNAse (exonuclease V) beta subunit
MATQQNVNVNVNVMAITENAHARDALIEFEAGAHKYTCAGEGNYTSVTTWNHSHFKQFDADAIISKMMSNKKTWPNSPYFGQTREEIKKQWDKNRDEAAQLGTDLHAAIEDYYTTIMRAGAGAVGAVESELAPAFLDFVQDHPHLKPYRSEWMIFDEDVRLAGSIDMVFYEGENTDELYIYDWKRCKEIKKTNAFGESALTECIAHLPDTNYWHYALQLNTYKAILENKYGKKVTRLCLVCLHPNLPSYQIFKVPDLASEMAALLALRSTQMQISK